MIERLAMLISGGGTTMEQMGKACQSGEVPMDIACVIASNPTAGGIEKARRLGIPEKDIVVVNPKDFLGSNGKVSMTEFGVSLLEELRKRKVTVVTQNGWLPLTPESVIGEFEDVIFNQHPGPVPEFGGDGMFGKRVHAARLLFVGMTQRDCWTEAIAQRVHQDFDQGAVVKSATVDILPDDTVDDLQQRVLPIEHFVQIELLKDIAAGVVREAQNRPRLIRPEEEVLLTRVKKQAIALYPHG
jgi:phosphoribosylglycinamide formyltransferase-1